MRRTGKGRETDGRQKRGGRETCGSRSIAVSKHVRPLYSNTALSCRPQYAAHIALVLNARSIGAAFAKDGRHLVHWLLVSLICCQNS